MRVDFTAIIAIVSGTGMIVLIVTIACIASAVGKRGASRKELRELRQDISQIKESIDDMREQLADIVIRLS